LPNLEPFPFFLVNLILKIKTKMEEESVDGTFMDLVDPIKAVSLPLDELQEYLKELKKNYKLKNKREGIEIQRLLN
tara:strand:- start:546 stop:773 length:228 start_codon:yes stop_codon:yes gene_type:complete